MNSIQTEWERFEQSAFSPSVSEKQRKAMKLAFYCGARSLLNIAYELGHKDVSEEVGVATMEALMEESKVFILQVLKGEA